MEGLDVVVGCGDFGGALQGPVSDGIDKAVVALQGTPARRASS
jgi:hypothetical protein